ncbi:MAG: hypothetical protein JNK37_04755 [Verrucomicrobiales bacterium]|nr:hypothetical protein [Verrucomicrobiales bacterium]
MTTILILTVAGVAALLIELVVPGGIVGIAGGICLVVAAVLCHYEYGFWAGFAYSVVVGCIGLGLIGWWMRQFHRLPFTRGLILQERSAGSASAPAFIDLTGETAVALTDLSPSGRVLLHGAEKLDAVAESHAIARGETVRLIRRSGPAWVVRAGEPDPIRSETADSPRSHTGSAPAPPDASAAGDTRS